ncbi:MAG: Nif11-like leader peptide family RiPP precursor [Bacillota bacterium]
MGEIKRFNKDVKEDKEMLEEVKKIGNDLEKIVKYANSKGYEFTSEDLESQADNNSELSEEQLDEVAGGFSPVVSFVVGGVRTVLVM